MWRVLLEALLVVVLLASEGVSQSCEPAFNTPCSQLVPFGTPVFVPPGWTVDLLQHYASGFVNLINLAGVGEPCHTYVLQNICGTWLRPCFTIDNVSVPIPQEPCLLVCQEYFDYCVGVYPFTSFPLGTGSYFPSGGPPLNCSLPVVDIYAGNSTFYPEKETFAVYGAQNYSVPCSLPPLNPPALTICSEPLVTAITADGAPRCVFTCPLPSLSEAQYSNVKVLQGIVGWFSWVTSLLLIIFLVVYPRSRDFPRNMVIMTACAANIVAGAIILPTYAGYEETWCGGSDTTFIPKGTLTGLGQFGFPTVDWQIDDAFLAVGSSLCTFQGAMLQFGFLAAVFWWVLIAFNMCLELFLHKVWNMEQVSWKWLRFGIYTLFGWGLPFVLMVIPAAAGRIKFVPAGTYCFVTNEDNYAWSFSFWFIPVGTSLLLGVTLFITAIIRVSIILITIKKFMKLVALYLRLFIFIFLYLVLIVFITAYNIQVANNQGEINQGYADYYNCLLVEGQGCSLGDSISNYNLVMLKAWALSSLGVLLFIIFFFSWDGMRFWGLLIRSCATALYYRRAQDVTAVLHMVTYKSNHASLHTATERSLTIVDAIPEEEEEEQSEKATTEIGEEAAGGSSSSSASVEEGTEEDGTAGRRGDETK